MMRTIADFAPDEVESGVGLALQDADGRYIFFLAGDRHRCPPGELFYAGIGGHREMGEDWLSCAHREAQEEVGTDVDILPARITWYVSGEGVVRRVEVSDRPRPYMLYEMIHPSETPQAGGLYRIVIFKALLHGQPTTLPADEVKAVIALTREQVAQSLSRKPRLGELLDEGAALVAGEKAVDKHVRLYPLGTARALAHLLCEVAEA